MILRNKKEDKKINGNNKQTPWSESSSELFRPSDRLSSAKLVATFEDRELLCSQRSGSPRLEPLFFFLVAPQLYS
jgi:hypothetical protein